MKDAQTIGSLLGNLRQNRPTSPRLIWYGPAAERIELSGRVLDNWVAKTANLLVDELDAEEGTTIALDMPPHWRSLSWALAGWQTGGTIRLDPDDTAADVIVSTEPGRFEGTTTAAQHVVAVALGALEMRWNGQLPAGVLDYAADVRVHADEYLGFSVPEGPGTALEYGTDSVAYNRLFSEFAGAAADAAAGEEQMRAGTRGLHGHTVLISAGLPMAEVLQLALGAWAADGAVVLVHPSVEVTDALLGSERITRRFEVRPGR